MIFVYIILVILICYLVNRKKNKPRNNLPESKKKCCLTVLSKFVIAVFVIYMGFMVFMIDAIVVDYWVFFGKNRTAEIENMYGIIVDDDIKLKNYKVTSWMEGKTRSLEFESNIDGMSFIEKNCKGKFLQYEESTEVKYYYYEYQGKNYQMTFYNEGDSYRVKIY